VNAPAGWAREAVAVLRPMMKKYDGVIDLHAGGNDLAALASTRADSVTFDASAVEDVPAAIDALRGSTTQVGVAFGPDFTPAEVATAVVGADLVLCPCEGEGVIERLHRLAVMLPPEVVLEVEGGVSQENARRLFNAGATVLVADHPIFDREDLPRAYRRLVQALA
jgi:pentose-5-phosphate-3-epimerase